MLDWLARYRINEYSDVLGLIVTVVGFAFTLYRVRKTKEAAEAASESVEKVRRDLKKFEVIAEFSSAITSMDEIKRLHRRSDLELLPERYSSLRRSLIALRTLGEEWTEADQILLQEAISQFALFERQVDRKILQGSKLDVARLNRIVSGLMDKLFEVLTRLRASVEVKA